MAGGTDASDPWGMREEPQEIQGLGNMEIRQQQQHILRGESTSAWARKYEPRLEKTGLRCFGLGPTQTGLYSHRRWLEA